MDLIDKGTGERTCLNMWLVADGAGTAVSKHLRRARFGLFRPPGVLPFLTRKKTVLESPNMISIFFLRQTSSEILVKESLPKDDS